MDRRELVFRPTMALLPVGLLYLASLGRFFVLQGAPAPEAGAAVESLVIREAQLASPRGVLLDRAGRVLAEDRPCWLLVMDAAPETRRWIRELRGEDHVAKLAEARVALAGLAATIGADSAAWERFVFDPQLYHRVLQRGIGELNAARARDALAACAGNGLRLERAWERVYPQGRALAQAIGLVKADEHGARKGVDGLELVCDSVLATGAGARQALGVAGDHGVNPLLSYRPDGPAPQVRTSLDAALGALAREELAAAVRAARAEWACAVAMDVRSGEVLLAAGVPDYDPNAPGLDPAEPVGFSLPVHWPLEPGSTVKPFVVARALAESAISRGERFDNHGGAWRLPGRTIRNVTEIPTSPMTAREVLRHSSNIGAAQIGMRLGAERMRALWLDLGVHQSGGLPALEGNPGHFPSDADWRKPNAAHWSVASTAYGHEISFTPLRLACAWSALLNGGVLMRPQWFAGQPPQPERRVFPEAIAREVSGWLEEVVSGRADKVLPAWPDLRWGGKSGTAKKTHEDGYDLLFVAFGPIEDPRVVVVVVVDDPHQGKPRGSLMAGPAAGRILRGALEQLGVVGSAARLDSRVPPDTVRGR